MNIVCLLICSVCHSDAGSALNYTNSSQNHRIYSCFLVQVICILILSDDVAIINQDLRSIVSVSWLTCSIDGSILLFILLCMTTENIM